jgi:hypothetical protein
MNASTPQESDSWLRVAGSGVNARSGIGDRYLASRHEHSTYVGHTLTYIGDPHT